MQIFSIVCLSIIIIALQHIINYLSRLIESDRDMYVARIILILICLLVAVFLTKYLILLTYPLIK